MIDNNKPVENQAYLSEGWGIKITIVLFAFSTTLFFVLGVVWLGLLTMLFLAVLYSSWELAKRFKSTKWFKIVRTGMVFLGVFVISIFMRLFVFEVYEIPSESMENTLIPGDKILVNKLIIGPKTPKSPFDIPWVNLLFYMNKEARAHIDSTWWESQRLSGWSKVKRNDVLVFKNEPLGPDFFIKRCVALPGDELQIINSDIFINGKYADTNKLPEVKKKWEVYYNNLSGFEALLDSLNLNFFYQDYRSNEFKRTLVLTRNETEKLKQSQVVDSLSVEVLIPNINHWLSPYGKRGIWTIDNYGPIKIPYKGWTIEINEKTVTNYFETIRTWEHKIIETIEGSFYIDGEEVTDYTFQNNYYMFMGDCRYNSVDSRFWGFLPEHRIVGKSTNILWSNNDEGIKWKRTFKRIK